MNGILPATDDPDTAPFWIAAQDHRLVVQKLVSGELVFPPRSAQPGSTWQEVSGRGRIWSFVVIHGPTLTAYADQLPFPVAIVELEEGRCLRMVGNLRQAPGAALNSLSPDTIKIGQPVRVCFERVADDVVIPCWVPVS
jgi:uncharacterized protein